MVWVFLCCSVFCQRMQTQETAGRTLQLALVQASGWWWSWLLKPCSSLLLGVSSFSVFSFHAWSDFTLFAAPIAAERTKRRESTLSPGSLLARCTVLLAQPSYVLCCSSFLSSVP